MPKAPNTNRFRQQCAQRSGQARRMTNLIELRLSPIAVRSRTATRSAGLAPMNAWPDERFTPSIPWPRRNRMWSIWTRRPETRAGWFVSKRIS